jgi:hypothetical protein
MPLCAHEVNKLKQAPPVEGVLLVVLCRWSPRSFPDCGVSKAQDTQVTKSVNSLLDARVVDAILQSRFRPATLDNQPIPISMSLTVGVQH